MACLLGSKALSGLLPPTRKSKLFAFACRERERTDPPIPQILARSAMQNKARAVLKRRAEEEETSSDVYTGSNCCCCCPLHASAEKFQKLMNTGTDNDYTVASQQRHPDVAVDISPAQKPMIRNTSCRIDQGSFWTDPRELSKPEELDMFNRILSELPSPDISEIDFSAFSASLLDK